MTGPSLRALLENPRPARPGPPNVVPARDHSENEYEPYANGRIGNQPQLTLLFRKASGQVRGFGYSYYYAIESDDPSCGFIVDFSGTRVEVLGVNLERLFRLVCHHRAIEIVEASRAEHMALESNAPVVERIRFLDK